MSYNGGLDFGLLGDYDALADIDLVAEGIDSALAELLAVARGEHATAPTNGGNREPVLPLPSTRATTGPAADMRAKRTGRPRPQPQQKTS
jgi:hypothetical protein